MQGASQKDMPPPEEVKAPVRKSAQSDALRWLTAGIAIPVILTFAWLGGWFTFAAVAVVMVLGTLEFAAMLKHAGYHPLLWLSIALSLLFMVAPMFPAFTGLILQIGLSVTVLVSLPLFLVRKRHDGAPLDWALTLAMAIYIGWPLSIFNVLRGYEAGQLYTTDGRWFVLPAGIWWLLVTLLGVWGFDSAAFFAGRAFGRHKLAPTISPGKTWEGVLGGMVLSIIASLLFTVVPLGVPWYMAVLLGIAIGVASTLGDLSESLIKRQMHVKDSGQIMPGHGGMLDRIDSLLFAVMVVYIFAQILKLMG